MVDFLTLHTDFNFKFKKKIKAAIFLLHIQIQMSQTSIHVRSQQKFGNIENDFQRRYCLFKCRTRQEKKLDLTFRISPPCYIV